VGVGVGVGVADGDGEGDALGVGDVEALGLADGDGLAPGEAEPLGLGDAEPLAEGLILGELDGDTVGLSATMGDRDAFGRAAKNRGGRLKVGTSNQNGACGSSAK